MTQSTKNCVKCKNHFLVPTSAANASVFPLHVCTVDNPLIQSPEFLVTGDNKDARSCVVMRGTPDWCGPAAKLFQSL